MGTILHPRLLQGVPGGLRWDAPGSCALGPTLVQLKASPGQRVGQHGALNKSGELSLLVALH